MTTFSNRINQYASNNKNYAEQNKGDEKASHKSNLHVFASPNHDGSACHCR